MTIPEPSAEAGPNSPPRPETLGRARRFLARLEAAFVGHGAIPGASDQGGEKSANELAAQRTIHATDRTMMAADRSLMAWVRTALSLISFGFTIYKLLQGFAEAGTSLSHASSPRSMGMWLTGMGTISMVLGTVEYWYRLKDLRHYRYYALWRPSFVMALLMSGTGLFLFIAIIAKAL